MYEKLLEIYKMVNLIIENTDDLSMVDEVTHCQCELPYKLKEIETDLITMFE